MTILGRWYGKALCFATFAVLAGVAFAGPTARNYVGLSDTAGNNVTMAAGNVPISGTVSITAAVDPCASMAVAKSSVFIEITTVTIVELVAPVVGQKIYVCGFSVAVGGTAPGLQFEYGTKTTTPCDTGATALTGTYNPTAGSVVLSAGFTGSQFTAPAAKELCAATGGSALNIAGYLSYVQQ